MDEALSLNPGVTELIARLRKTAEEAIDERSEDLRALASRAGRLIPLDKLLGSQAS